MSVARARFDGTVVLGDRVELSASESHHLVVVRRLRSGAELEILDASGRRFAARLVDADRRSARIEPLRQLEAPAEGPEIVLIAAVLKGPRMDWLVEKASELGAARLWPLLASRSLPRPSAARLSRWRRLAQAASKQCGRPRALEIASAVELLELPFAEAPRPRFLMDPAGGSLSAALAGAKGVTLAVGPEGGFDSAERCLIQSRRPC